MKNKTYSPVSVRRTCSKLVILLAVLLPFAAFADDAKKLAGVIPVAVGDSGIWASAELFESTLLGMIGPDRWKAFFSGKMAFDGPAVKQAAQSYAKILEYQNSDHSALTWDQAIKAVQEGRCAFSSMGDSAHGEFTKANNEIRLKSDLAWVRL